MSECGCQNRKKNTQAKPKPWNGANKSFQVVQGTRTWFGVGQLLLGEAIGGKKESLNRGIPANSLVNPVVLVLHVVAEDFETFCLRNLVRALRHFCVHLPIESRQAIGKDLAVLAEKLDAFSSNGAPPTQNPLIRLAGTSSLRANSAALMPSSLSSSAKCSPGCIAVIAMVPPNCSRRPLRFDGPGISGACLLCADS